MRLTVAAAMEGAGVDEGVEGSGSEAGSAGGRASVYGRDAMGVGGGQRRSWHVTVSEKLGEGGGWGARLYVRQPGALVWGSWAAARAVGAGWRVCAGAGEGEDMPERHRRRRPPASPRLARPSSRISAPSRRPALPPCPRSQRTTPATPTGRRVGAELPLRCLARQALLGRPARDAQPLAAAGGQQLKISGALSVGERGPGRHVAVAA